MVAILRLFLFLEVGIYCYEFLSLNHLYCIPYFLVYYTSAFVSFFKSFDFFFGPVVIQ